MSVVHGGQQCNQFPWRTLVIRVPRSLRGTTWHMIALGEAIECGRGDPIGRGRMPMTAARSAEVAKPEILGT